MNLEQYQYDILRLKLRRTEIIFEKMEVIKAQRYEQACELREKERKIIDELTNIEAKLMHYDAHLELNRENFRKKLTIRTLLIELNPMDYDFAQSCLETTEKTIAELREKRQAFLSEKNQEAAEPVIIELNEKLKLRNEIQQFLLRNRND